jgi:hypothetical protein
MFAVNIAVPFGNSLRTVIPKSLKDARKKLTRQ